MTRPEVVNDVVVVVSPVVLLAAAVARGRGRAQVHVVKLLFDGAGLEHTSRAVAISAIFVLFHGAAERHIFLKLMKKNEMFYYK